MEGLLLEILAELREMNGKSRRPETKLTAVESTPSWRFKTRGWITHEEPPDGRLLQASERSRNGRRRRPPNDDSLYP